VAARSSPRDGSGKPVSEWVGISGTVRNYAGGVTPWGTWYTCEETFINAGTTWTAGTNTGTYAKDHGYVFEVLRGDSKHQLPKPIKAFGRFEHEALAVEPSLQRVYLSEDASGPIGLFYRWTAPHGVRLREGAANWLPDTAGKLEAMQIRLDDGSVLPDVAYLTSAQIGRPFKVTWTEVPDRDARTTPTRKQFADGTVTRGKKFEGVLSTGKGCYIVNSFAFADADLPADATRHDGMVVLQLRRANHHPGHVLPAQPGGRVRGRLPELRRPDLRRPRQRHRDAVGHAGAGRGRREGFARAEHGAGRPDVRHRPQHDQQRHLERRPDVLGIHRHDVLPDGRVPFVNIQVPGITLAITGRWEKYLG
jgi:hypothetical protein